MSEETLAKLREIESWFAIRPHAVPHGIIVLDGQFTVDELQLIIQAYCDGVDFLKYVT